MAEADNLTTEEFAALAGVHPNHLTLNKDLYPPRHRGTGRGFRYAKADIAIWQKFKGALRSVDEYEAAMAHERASGRG
ncbi:hypothetical protein SAMN05877838_3800 [Hoeflea halophila]|uniref:Helix-turn-helix protein n=1 Tax=Hoeflea halophila TaxID=714899 RepID=A0A286IGT4_9HYPH|nr:hypothetical protein [Hoeflea halophila]SOE18856.1 hypothetical protein SAMN05877838_3800 [Hoeflea halophila]